MNLAEYASYDALGLAELVAKKQVSAKELARTAVAAKERIDPAVKSVVELYPDRIEDLDEKSLGDGPFRPAFGQAFNPAFFQDGLIRRGFFHGQDSSEQLRREGRRVA